MMRRHDQQYNGERSGDGAIGDVSVSEGVAPAGHNLRLARDPEHRESDEVREHSLLAE